MPRAAQTCMRPPLTLAVDVVSPRLVVVIQIRLRLLKLGEPGAAACLNQFSDELLAGVSGPLDRLAAADRLSEIMDWHTSTHTLIEAMEAAGEIEPGMIGYEVRGIPVRAVALQRFDTLAAI